MFEYQFWSLNFNSWYCFSSIQWSIFWRYDSISGDTTKFSDWNTSFYPWDFFDLQFRTIPWYFNKKQHCIKHHTNIALNILLSNVGSRQKVPFIEKCFCVFNKIQNFYKYENTMHLNDDPKRRRIKILQRPENLWAIITLTEIPTSWVFSTIQKLG